MRLVRRRRILGYSELFDGTTSGISYGVQNLLAVSGPRTIVSLWYGLGTGESASGALFSQAPAGVASGPRLTVEHNAGSPFLQYRQGSTGSTGAPARNSANGSVAYNVVNWSALLYNGGLTGSTDIRMFNGVNGAIATELAYGGAATGSGTAFTGSGEPTRIGDRQDLDRSFNGYIGYTALFDHELTADERLDCQLFGPLAVEGLVLFRYNGRDEGPFKLITVSQTNIVESPPLEYNQVPGIVDPARPYVEAAPVGASIPMGSRYIYMWGRA